LDKQYYTPYFKLKLKIKTIKIKIKTITIKMYKLLLKSIIAINLQE